jgi:hypothetical protein
VENSRKVRVCAQGFAGLRDFWRNDPYFRPFGLSKNEVPCAEPQASAEAIGLDARGDSAIPTVLVALASERRQHYVDSAGFPPDVSTDVSAYEAYGKLAKPYHAEGSHFDVCVHLTTGRDASFTARLLEFLSS